MKRLDTIEECYAALHEAIDVIKACQAAANRGVGGLPLTKLAEARAALDVGSSDIERHMFATGKTVKSSKDDEQCSSCGVVGHAWDCRRPL